MCIWISFLVDRAVIDSSIYWNNTKIDLYIDGNITAMVILAIILQAFILALPFLSVVWRSNNIPGCAPQLFYTFTVVHCQYHYGEENFTSRCRATNFKSRPHVLMLELFHANEWLGNDLGGLCVKLCFSGSWAAVKHDTAKCKVLHLWQYWFMQHLQISQRTFHLRRRGCIHVVWAVWCWWTICTGETSSQINTFEPYIP